MERVLKNYPVFIPHLNSVIANLERQYKASTVTTATDLKTFYVAKNVVLLIVFQTDVQTEFSRQSLIFQSNDQSSKYSII